MMKPEEMDDLFLRLKTRRATVGIIGLGYVGLPLLLQAHQYLDVIGYDIDERRVAEISQSTSSKKVLSVSSDPKVIAHASVYIVCVPTDITEDKLPDLTHLKDSSRTISKFLNKGDVVIYESTVYPGCTEEECLPLLESGSGLAPNVDFTIGYAPERIVPGVDGFELATIPRVVSAGTEVGRQFVYNFYTLFIKADIHIAPSIKVAEAAKIVENTQRDLNISLMNELSIIFDKLEIDTQEVLDAAATKWNFHPYHPGLVGGHCISVDPFYLLYKSRAIGHEPKVIAAGREINDYLPLFVAEKLESTLLKNKVDISNARIVIFGITFKENIDDIRNSKVVDLVKALKQKGASVTVKDNHVSSEVIQNVVGEQKEIDDTLYDAAIIAVQHTDVVALGVDYFYNLLSEDKILFDLKRVVSKKDKERFQYWAL